MIYGPNHRLRTAIGEYLTARTTPPAHEDLNRLLNDKAVRAMEELMASPFLYEILTRD